MGYLIKKTFLSLFRSFKLYVFALIILALTYYICTFYLLFFINARNIIQSTGVTPRISLFLKASTSPREINTLKSALSQAFPKSKLVITKGEEYFRDLKKDLKIDEKLIESIPKNVFGDRIELTAASQEEIQAIERFIKESPYPQWIQYSDSTVPYLNEFDEFIRSLNVIALIILPIIFLISIIIVSLTIHLAIAPRQIEIYIQNILGATPFYIKTPLIIEGTLIGLVGMGLTLTFLYFSFNLFQGWLATIFPFLFKGRLMTFFSATHILLFLALAVINCVIAGLFATRHITRATS